jgi:hypothetical protein
MRFRLPTVIILSLSSLLASSTAGASISVKTAGKQFLKDVAPLNAAFAKFETEASKWNNSTSEKEAVKEAAPAIAAMRKFQVKLLSQSWPKKARNDIRTLYSGFSPLEADLVILGEWSTLNVSNWVSKYTTDFATLSSDDNFVRHDLRLPLHS